MGLSAVVKGHVHTQQPVPGPRGVERDLCLLSLGSPSLVNGTVSKSPGPIIRGVICFCSESFSPPDYKSLRAPVLVTLTDSVLFALRAPVLITLKDSVLVTLSS